MGQARVCPLILRERGLKLSSDLESRNCCYSHLLWGEAMHTVPASLQERQRAADKFDSILLGGRDIDEVNSVRKTTTVPNGCFKFQLPTAMRESDLDLNCRVHAEFNGQIYTHAMLAQVASASVYYPWDAIRKRLSTNPDINVIPSRTTLLPVAVDVFRS